MPFLQQSKFKIVSKHSYVRFLIACLIFSICWAFYTGFRAPNLWSINYYQISWLDGFYRRGLLGTLIYPSGCWRFNYYFIEMLQFLVLGFTLGMFICGGYKNNAIAILIIYFCSAAGGYFFHEVGYVDQLLWIFTFLTIIALHNKRNLLASLLMLASVMMHEMALFIVIPLVWVYVIISRGYSAGNLLKVFTPSLLFFLLLYLFFQAVPTETIRQYFERAVSCGYSINRKDFLSIYEYSFEQRARFFYTKEQIALMLLPMAVLAGILVSAAGKVMPLGIFARITIYLCCLIPFALGYWGKDTSRWIFLTFTQIMLVWLIILTKSKNSNIKSAFSRNVFLIAFVLVALILRFSYFDGFSRRGLSYDGLISFGNYFIDQVSTLPRR